MAGRDDRDRLVWSSERGDLRSGSPSGEGRRRAPGGPGGGGSGGGGQPPADGIVRVRRETKGRKGKGVTTISGVPLGEDGLLELAAELKRRCGTGGTVKDGGVIEIQGDHRDEVVPLLEARGWTVKLAGG
jgi:translation initiation factor 1